MEKWIDDLLVDVSPPEQAKFRSPLILVHGLWTGSWCWRTWATHLSNLGWECWAANFRGRADKRPDEVLRRLNFHDCVEDLGRIIEAAPFPPVLLAHGLGGLVAQKVAEGGKISALVLLASLAPRGVEISLPRTLALLRIKYWPLIYLGRPIRAEARDLRRSWLASVPEGEREGILGRMVPDSARLVGEFFTRRVEVDSSRIRCPLLAVGGAEDAVVPPGSLRELARRLGADLKNYPNHGHWMMEEAEGESIVSDIHRWIIQKLGEKILVAEFSSTP